MKKAAERLTKRLIDAALPSEGRRYIWDSDLPGFGIRIEVSGTKTFIIRYRAEGGGRTAPRRFMALGRHGILTAEQARARAKQLLGAAASGADPAKARSAKRQERTVAQLVEFYADQGTDHLKELTRRYTLARLRHHVLPTLGTKKLTEITPGDVERMMRTITLGTTASDVKRGPRVRIIVTGGAGAAAKVVRDLSAVFAFAQRHSWMTTNPCRAARKQSDEQRKAYLSGDDLRRLGDALRQVEAEGGNVMALTIIKLLVLTGCRRNEIAGLRWSEIDFDRSCLRLSDTKTGDSVRPLGGPASDILRAIRRAEDSKYVFPATSGASHYQGMKRVWKRVRELANLPTATPHTLRHTLASDAVSHGETLPVIGAMLGHANARATERYAHVAQDPTKKAAERVSSRIAAALNGGQARTSSATPTSDR